jgi:hypothetical protein
VGGLPLSAAGDCASAGAVDEREEAGVREEAGAGDEAGAGLFVRYGQGASFGTFGR